MTPRYSRPRLAFVAVLCCFLPESLCVATIAARGEVEPLKADLVRTEAEFFRHAHEHGFNAGLQAYMAEDALIANSLVLGRTAQAAKMNAESTAAKPRAAILRWKPLRADVSAAGDLGYTWGVAESAPTHRGPFKPYGIYVTIWRRQPDGRWKFVYDSATILAAEALERFVRDNFPAAPVR